MKVTLIMVQSINGKIRMNENDTQKWTSIEDKKHFQRITKEIGVVIMGRKTFDSIGKPLKERLNIVLTGSPEKYNDFEKMYDKQLYFTDMIPEKILEHLENKGYTNVALIGGPTINSLFLEKDLIDEILLTIEPVIINGDLSLFSYVNGIHNFELKNIVKLNKNSLLLKYVKNVPFEED